jgi:hypothetical protein
LLTSSDTTANSETIIIRGTTVNAPAQPNGGGMNSSATVALSGGMLASGASINIRFLLGVQQDGNFRFLINVEAIPGTANVPDASQSNRKTFSTKAAGSGRTH